MYFQDEYIRENAQAEREATYKLDLPDTGLLGSLLLRLTGRTETGNPTASTHKWRLIDYLDKIEVILNGATVCKSLSGAQCQYLSFLDQKVVSPGKWLEYSQPTLKEYILINFGRYFNDPELALHLDNFRSVELHITNSCNSTIFQDDLRWSVLAHWLREPTGPPLGYMRSEEWRSWSTLAGETKYFDLPTEHTLRRIMLQATPAVDDNCLEKTNLFNLMDDIELSFQTGILRVFKGGLDDLLYQNVLDTGVQPVTGGWVYHTPDKGFNVGLGYVDAVATAAGSLTEGGAVTIPTVQGTRNSFTQKAETYEADVLIGFLAKGIAYHNCGVFRFDHDQNPVTWLDPNARRTVQLNIHTRDHADAEGGTNAIVLDRFVRY